MFLRCKRMSVVGRNFHTSCALLGSRPTGAKSGKKKGEVRDTSGPISRPEEFQAAARDYLRAHPELNATKRIPKSREQLKRDEALHNIYSHYINIITTRFKQEKAKKRELVDKALAAMPEPLRVEAKKTDFTDFPMSVSLHPYTLPPVPSFKLPPQPLRNEL